MLKKILAGLVCLSMVFAFAACESSDDSKEDTKDSSSAVDVDNDADDNADADTDSDADDSDSADATDAVEIDASVFVGTSWSSTFIMTDEDHASTIEDYAEATGVELSTLQTTITFTDEQNCVVTSGANSEEGTWTFADGTFTLTDPEDGSEQALVYNAEYNALILSMGELSLGLTQSVQ